MTKLRKRLKSRKRRRFAFSSTLAAVILIVLIVVLVGAPHLCPVNEAEGDGKGCDEEAYGREWCKFALHRYQDLVKGGWSEEDAKKKALDQYLVLMSDSGWGGNVEVKYAMEALGVPIRLWLQGIGSDGGQRGKLASGREIHSLNMHRFGPEGKELNLYYNGIDHYDWLKPDTESEYEFSREQVQGDGHCLFESLAQSYNSRFGGKLTRKEVRLMVVEKMREDIQDLKNYFVF